MKRITIIVLLACAGTVLAGLASAATSGNLTQKGVVTEVVDGDTVRVRLASGKSERVRLIGIDAAERGACFATQAAARARQLALSKPVVLRGDQTQATRDRYGRLLAYVWVPGGRDLGYQLVAGGFAKVYVYGSPFQRLPAYRTAESRARSTPAGAWKACAPATIRPVPPRLRSFPPHRLRSFPPRRLRPGTATRATRPACRSSTTSTAPTSARSASPPFASPARIRTGSTPTTTATAASRPVRRPYGGLGQG